MRKKLLVFVLILISIPIILALFNFAKQGIKNKTAKAKIVSARRTAEKTLNEKVNNAIDILNRSEVTASNLVSSKVDVCYVTHKDQGWFAASWYQDCYLRYVSSFVTRLSKNEVRQKLVVYPEVATYFGKVSTISTNLRTTYCGLFEKNYHTTLLYRPVNITSDEYSCRVPNPLQGIGSVKGPIILDDELSVKTYKIFNSSSIDNAQSQIWIMFDEYYYHEELGCGIGIIFCSSPRSKPVHPSI